MRKPDVSLAKTGLATLCAAASLVAVAFSTPARAACGSRPGTPNEVQMVATSPTSVQVSWRNTTGRVVQAKFLPLGLGAVPNSESRMWFDMYLHHEDGRPTGKNLTGAGPYSVSYGSRSSRTFTGLAPRTKYCFAMRARTEGGTQGCVSAATSNWGCAATR